MTASEYDDLKRFIEDYKPNKEQKMTDETTLLPCPFCGGEAYYGYGSIVCYKCSVRTTCNEPTSVHNSQKLIDAWNRRYTEDDLK